MERMGAVPVRSHAPGYRGTRVLVHGLFLPAAAWELPPLQGEEPGAELGSLEEMGAACTEPSLAASSLGSWANDCERADAALAAAEAQMGGDARTRVWETTSPLPGTRWRRRTGSG